MNRNNQTAFVLTVYKILLNENEPIQIVSYIKQHDISTYENDKELLLKKQKVSDILYNHIQPLYDEIISRYKDFKKCPITEICRHICDSVDNATRISKRISSNISISQGSTIYKYTCEKCGIYTNSESHWIRHQLSITHSKRVSTDENNLFNCENCDKCFLSRSFLWKHKKTCNESPHRLVVKNHMAYDISPQVQPVDTSTEIVNEVVAIVQDKLIDLYKTSPPVSNTQININNRTTNNNHFNLNFFLNETCKNAITINEFLENIHVGADTVEYAGINGYVAGISKIIIDELKRLGCEMRPIHCTDAKRETLYIKEKDGWEKDNDEKAKLSKAIRTVACKNILQMHQWRTENPRCEISGTEESNFEIRIMMGCNGSGNEKMEHGRICREIARFAYIDKEVFS